ncbi:undecaprenyl-diphosphatase [Fictibacillus enclensis]|uniref:undecaprenyl-diphosphatase n=1 Tax=Fictibacillus enclensis TaxID=1017270 RepID=UPI0025A20B47|nr:undecaprenyl-diphosphatase [Fictibacillus enclensis]MDM5337216.1 undecaprenyl-diphosphatase [Fictibacillus enclensis]
MDFTQFNNETFRSINQLADPLSALNPFMVFLAEYMLYMLGIVLIGYFLTRSKRNRLMVVFAIVSCLVAEIFGRLAGLFYSHHQPFSVLPDANQLIEHAIDNSFPSDHSIIFFSVCTVLLLFKRKTGAIWMFIACCVAISRVWVGVHYPVDVVTGGLLGIFSAVLVVKTMSGLPFAKMDASKKGVEYL